MIQNQKMKMLQNVDQEKEFTNTFEALGGVNKELGFINKDKLQKLLMDEFGLEIDMELFLKEIDIDKDGDIDFQELRNLLKF